jgi:hypothetical protein
MRVRHAFVILGTARVLTRGGVVTAKTRRWVVMAMTVVASLALTAVTVSPVQAIRNPTPDGGGHTYVGVLVDDFGRPGLYDRACTATLVAPTLMITAAHCYYNPKLGFFPADHVWVSFDPEYMPGPVAPAVHGTVVVYPGFRQGAAYFVHDIAVVHLDAPVDIAPAHLPSAGLLDSLDLRTQEFDVVGYGRTRSDKTGGPQSIDSNLDPVVRNSGTVDFRNLRVQDQWIMYQENLAQGESGTCRGDSGSGTFLAETDVMVSVLSVNDRTCRSWGGGPRLDTEDIRDFLSSQGVPLP